MSYLSWQRGGLEEFGSLHLKRKRAAGVSGKWLVTVETQLQRAVENFGRDRELSTIRPSDIGGWVEALRDTDNGRGGTLTDKTVRDHLNSLSNLYRRAGGAMEAVPARYNPVLAWLGGLDDAEKPTGNTGREAEWFEPHEAALLLEAARTYHPPTSGAPAHNFIHPLLAMALLTGGRKSEILGLKAEDVSFDRDVIRFRENEYRRLKTDGSTRTVPMWPQLREVLQRYVFDPGGPKSGLLFPSPRGGRMLREDRKQLDAVGERAGFEVGAVRFHKLRHTYTAARLQTTEHGYPVALFTVSRELGHSSTSLIEKRYGHLLTNRRVRGETVEFRVEEYEKEIGEEVLQALRLVTRGVTRASDQTRNPEPESPNSSRGFDLPRVSDRD